MKMNDADYFTWVASHLWQIQYGLKGMTIKYVNKKGEYCEFYFDYSLNNVVIDGIEDDELLRRVIDKIIKREREAGK